MDIPYKEEGMKEYWLGITVGFLGGLSIELLLIKLLEFSK